MFEVNDSDVMWLFCTCLWSHACVHESVSTKESAFIRQAEGNFVMASSCIA